MHHSPSEKRLRSDMRFVRHENATSARLLTPTAKNRRNLMMKRAVKLQQGDGDM
jgi:hypothetical protein